MIEIVDTNVILRFVVGDNKKQQLQTAKWFKEAENGKRKLLLKPIVIGEVTFVLESFYKFKKSQIAQVLEPFVQYDWLDVDERLSMILLWKYYLKGFHFVDSFLIAWKEAHDGKVLTFDQKILKS